MAVPGALAAHSTFIHGFTAAPRSIMVPAHCWRPEVRTAAAFRFAPSSAVMMQVQRGARSWRRKMRGHSLSIEPVILGGGKRVFPEDGEMKTFELVSAKTASTGVQVCHYRRAR